MTSGKDIPSSYRVRSKPKFVDWSTWLNPKDSIGQRVNFADQTSPPSKTTTPDSSYVNKNDSSTTFVPKAPRIQPMRLPSLAETAKSSWRLSFSIQNRGEFLRNLRQWRSPLVLDENYSDCSSEPPNRWLHSQGLRIPSRAVGSSGEETNLDSLASHVETCSAAHNFGGVDGGRSPGHMVHLHEMRISQRLASTGLQSYASSPQLSTRGSQSHRRGFSVASGGSRGSRNSRLKSRKVSDSSFTSDAVPGSWGQTLDDGASSYYPSSINSIHSSPKNSQLDLISSLVKVNSGSDLKVQKSFCLSKSFENLNENLSLTNLDSDASQIVANSNTLPLIFSTASLLTPPTQNRRGSLAGSSMDVSETESCRHRELELSLIRSRFRDSRGDTTLQTPRSSKFREEFHLNISQSEPCTPVKRSAFLRLTRLALKTLDGPMERPLEESLPLNTPTHPIATIQSQAVIGHSRNPARFGGSRGTNTSRGSTYLNPLSDDEVAGVWGKAWYQHSRSSSKPAKRQSLSGIYETSSRGVERRQQESSTNRTNWARQAVDEILSEYQQRKIQKEDEMDEWELEMKKSAQKAKEGSKSLIPKSKLSLDRRYPVSWSRFPSFNREQRVLAGIDDGVQQRDFASQSSHDDNDKANKADSPKGVVKKLGDSLVETLKETLPKFDPVAYESAWLDEARGRRGTLDMGGSLEYPELEILPIEVMSETELEHEVEEEIEEDQLEKKLEELDAILGPSKRTQKSPTLIPSPGGSKRAKSPRNILDITPGDINFELKKASDRMEKKLLRFEVATGMALPSPRPMVSAEGVNEVGMDADALAEQVVAGAKLKQKMDAARASGARRGPVARKRTIEESSVAIASSGDILHIDIGKPFVDGTGDELLRTDATIPKTDVDSLEHIHNSEVSPLATNITDPAFYNICIVSRADHEDSDCERVNVTQVSGAKNSMEQKFHSWGGRHHPKYKHHSLRLSPRKWISSEALLLRKSTDDFKCELEKVERLERLNFLHAAEKALGDEH